MLVGLYESYGHVVCLDAMDLMDLLDSMELMEFMDTGAAYNLRTFYLREHVY